MSDQEGPPSADFVDWVKIRQTKEYREHMAGMLRMKVLTLIHPDYLERPQETALDPADFASFEEFIAASLSLQSVARTEAEEKIDMGIEGLRTIEDIEEYVRAHNLEMDVAEEVRNLEATYLRDRKRFENTKQGPVF